MKGLQRIIRLAVIGIVVWAVAQELRKPAKKRTWHGLLAGVIPYDFRPPTTKRIRQTLWNPDDPRVIKGQVWGVGWTVNVGRLARLLRLT